MDNIKNKFIELCMLRGGLTKEGVKKNNKAMDELSKIYHLFDNDISSAQHFYLELMNHKDPWVKSTSAAHSLGLNVNVDTAKKVLKSISKDKDPIISFNAEMTLQVWKEQGYLNF